MSDEWIVQFGVVFVELEEIGGKRIRRQKSIYLTKILHAKAFFNNNVSLFLNHKNKRHDQHL